MENVQVYVDTAVEYAMLYLPKLLLAIIVLIVGAFLIKKAIRGIKNLLISRKMDLSLIPFLT